MQIAQKMLRSLRQVQDRLQVNDLRNDFLRGFELLCEQPEYFSFFHRILLKYASSVQALGHARNYDTRLCRTRVIRTLSGILRRTIFPADEKNPLKNGFLFCAGRRVFLSPEIDPCPGIERKIGKIPFFILQIAFRTDHRRIVRTEYFRW